MHSALLVIPSDWNVNQTVTSLRELGIDARPLVPDSQPSEDFMDEEATPKLLVSTITTTRGIDLPDLTHVFILGTKLLGNFHDYVHIAGRVGRISSKGEGKVITMVMADDDANAEARLAKVYQTLGITPAEWTVDLDDE
jgi:superfamily II DNA/RNA helicase